MSKLLETPIMDAREPKWYFAITVVRFHPKAKAGTRGEVVARITRLKLDFVDL